MSQIKVREKGSSNRGTRWDRIRKRYLAGNSPSIKTDAVRRFIEMDFIGKHNKRLLIDGDTQVTALNPHVVMDLRHKMFQQIPRKLPLATVANQRNWNSCIIHNQEVEERYIQNQLNKFRQKLEKDRKRCKVEARVERNLKVSNEPLIESLERTYKIINNFDEAPAVAQKHVEQICRKIKKELVQPAVPEILNEKKSEDCLIRIEETACDPVAAVAIESTTEAKPVESKIVTYNENGVYLVLGEDQTELDLYEQELELECLEPNVLAKHADAREDNNTQMNCMRTPSPLTPSEEFFKPMRAAAEQHMLQMRNVRFQEEITVQKFQREASSCSNTSDGIESVISDLAEEALMELEMEAAAQEEEEKIKPKVAKVENETKQLEAVTEVSAEQDRVQQMSPKPTVKQQQSLPNHDDLLVIRRLELTKQKENPTDGKVSSSDEEEEHESIPNDEQNHIIEQLFQSRTKTNNEVILRKCFLRWIHYTTIEKLEREHCSIKNDRVTKINAFLDKVRKEKIQLRRLASEKAKERAEISNGNNAHEEREGAVKIAKQYKNKIKVQQDIIDLQRIKLERQERIIMQLKLNKLTEEAQEARNEIKQELKAFIRSGDPKAKAKAKCLQLIGSLRDADDEEFARLEGKAMLQPKFLQNMQERALERSIRHEQARQRRLQQEAEREAQKIAAEEAKRQEDEEAKRLRIEILKEKRRQEKMAKILKERERQRFIANQQKAQDFYRRLLLRRIGIEGFKRLIQRKHDNQRKCEQLRQNIYKRNTFIAWHIHCVIIREQKLTLADDFYDHIVKRNCISAWKSHMQAKRSNMLVAIDWYDMKLSNSFFARWLGYTKRLKMIEETKMRQAISHHEWHLKWKVLDCWQRLPQILQLEKETEERRQRWRMKIWELLPDYRPNRDDLW